MQDIDKIKRVNKVLIALSTVCVCIILILVGIIVYLGNVFQSTENTLMEGELISIETPCCTLKYPSEHSKLLKCVDKKEDGVYSKIFYGCIDNRDIELFEISFGAKENATLIGYITHRSKNHPIFVRSSEIDETLSQDSQNTIYMMQEGINTVIQSIITNKNYTEAK